MSAIVRSIEIARLHTDILSSATEFSRLLGPASVRPVVATQRARFRLRPGVSGARCNAA
jgi:hypothetical protein